MLALELLIGGSFGSDGQVLVFRGGRLLPEDQAGGIGGSTGSTDNAALRADGAGGETAQSSLVLINDVGDITIPSGRYLKFGGGVGQVFNTSGTHLYLGGSSTYIDINIASGTLTTFGLDVTLDNPTLSGATGSGMINLTGTSSVTVPTPTTSTQAATKGYVDSLVEGFVWKDKVLASSTASVMLATDVQNGSILDGVTLTTGDRILLKDQSTASENGIWVVAASGAPSRPTDFATGAGAANDAVFVAEGTANADNAYMCTSDPGSDVIDTDNLVWTQFGTGGGIGGDTGSNDLAILIANGTGGSTLQATVWTIDGASLSTLNPGASYFKGAAYSVATMSFQSHNGTSYSTQMTIGNGAITIFSPTIADFSNAGHDHQDAAGGGQLDHSAVFSGGLAITSCGHTMSTGKILGRATASTGAIEEIAVTGTGSVVLANSPTLITPALGTPASGTLTNCTDAGGKAPVLRVYTSGDTWSKSAGLVALLVKIVGGGGGGGGVADIVNGRGIAGGGGAGGVSEKLIDEASLGPTETVTVGSGGSGGAAGANNGSAGGTSSFGAHLSATGGGGGAGTTSVTTSNNQNASGGTGGSGSSGDLNIDGGDGEDGITVGGQPWFYGGGGSNPMGVGGKGAGTSNGYAGGSYGGGGSGGSDLATSVNTNRAGGDGAGGVVIVLEYY